MFYMYMNIHFIFEYQHRGAEKGGAWGRPPPWHPKMVWCPTLANRRPPPLKSEI